MDCSSYTSFRSVLHASKHQGLDFPEHIASCEDACVVIFGTGNPDVSGLGAMIAFCIQAAAVVISGPLLPVLLFARYRRWPRPIAIQPSISTHHDRQCACLQCRTQLNEPFKKGIYAVWNRTYYAHLMLAIPLGVAAIIQLPKVPPVLERTYLERLIYAQFALTMALQHFRGRYFDSAGGMWGVDVHKVLVCLVTIINKDGTMSIPQAEELLATCHEVRGTADISKGLWAWKIYVMVAMVCPFGMLGLGWFPKAIIRSFHAPIHPVADESLSVRRLGALGYYCAIFLFSITMVIAHGLSLFILRNDTRKMAGSSYVDNNWGVGQTMAILPWVWFICQVFHDLWKIWLSDFQGGETRSERLHIEERIAEISLISHDQSVEPYTQPNARALLKPMRDPVCDQAETATTGPNTVENPGSNQPKVFLAPMQVEQHAAQAENPIETQQAECKHGTWKRSSTFPLETCGNRHENRE